jgi:hypothetical protein
MDLLFFLGTRVGRGESLGTGLKAYAEVCG